MNHPDPDTLVALALDTPPEGEREALLRHVRRCAACRALYRGYLEALGRLQEPLPVPPAWEEELRQRLAPLPPASRKGPESLPSPHRRWLLWAALGVILLGFLGVGGHRHYQDALAWRRFVALASEPGARMLPLVDPTGRQTGWALRTAQREVLLYLQAPPPPGRVYQAWLILPEGRRSLGVSPGKLLEVSTPLSEESWVGVSVEPPGGSPAPTTPSVGRVRI
ncbi:MAG: anti-sigma factor [Meiothermus sp.]